jgi:hypothetical protein
MLPLSSSVTPVIHADCHPQGWDDGYGGGGGYGEPGYGGGGYPQGGGGYGGPPGGGYGGPPQQQMQGGGPGYAGPRDAGRPYGGGPPAGEDTYARSGFPVQGPNGWVAYKTQDTGETYYHNHNSNVTQWDRPVDWPSAPA